jgi:hypothetical protein
MIKNHRKLIAAFAACAFIFLLQASSLPLRSEQAPSQSGTTMESSEQAPHFIEEEGGYSAQPKKKSILPIILGVVAVGAVAAVLFLVVLKTKYDITGTWDFNFVSIAPAHTWNWTLSFSGDKKQGTFKDTYGDMGKYTVKDKDVTIRYDVWNIALIGKFDGKDKMTGNAAFVDLTIGGKEITAATWTASRQASGNSLKPNAGFAQSLDGRKIKK